MGRVSGKIALVTGAASGIGRATATKLAEEGAAVILTDIDEVGGTEVAASIREHTGVAEFMSHDVTIEKRWQEIISHVTATRGRLDVLVNNAGIVRNTSIVETSLDEWRRVIAVNLDAVFLGTRCGIQAMSASGGGSIVNVSSVYGLVGAIGAGSYCASKGGVRLFTKAAALECAAGNTGVRVNSVHPGFVDTAMIDEVLEATPSPSAARQMIERMHPVKRMADPMEVASAILFLASDESSFVTGSELVVDGGMTAR